MLASRLSQLGFSSFPTPAHAWREEVDGTTARPGVQRLSADLALRRAPAVADAASAATVRRAGKLLRVVLAQHLLDGPDPSRQAEALK